MGESVKKESISYVIYYPAVAWDGEKFLDLVVPKRRIIDAHVHCLFVKESLRSPEFKQRYGFNPIFEGTPVELIEMMNISDVEKSVIFTGGLGGTTEEARETNGKVAEIIRDFSGAGGESTDGGRLIGLGYAPADGNPNVIPVVREAVEKFKLRGLGEIFAVNGAKDYRYIFEAADELGLPVCIDAFEWTDEDANWFTENVGKFPRMKLIFAHAGNNHSGILRLAKKFSNVFFDISWAIHFYEARVLQQIKDVGADKMLFGTDFPATCWGMYDDILRLERMPLSEEEKNMIFFENAEKLFSIRNLK